MKVYIASDHAGIELKAHLIQHLKNLGNFVVSDLGPNSNDSVDYPDFANKVCTSIHGFSVSDGHATTSSHLSEFGVLICGSGQGMAIRANKYKHIRAALCYDLEVTKLSRQHNDANVLCLGARFVTKELAEQILKIFIDTHFDGGRHSKRVEKVSGDTA